MRLEDPAKHFPTKPRIAWLSSSTRGIDTEYLDIYCQIFVIGVAVAALPRYGSLYICSIVRNTL